MDYLFYLSMGILIAALGSIFYKIFAEMYIQYKCSLLQDDYVPNTYDDPQLTTPDCPECKRSGKFTILYIDPINKNGKYKQCICGYVEDLPEDK